MKLLLCDDNDDQRAETFAVLDATLGKDAETEMLSTDELTEAVTDFFSKVRARLDSTTTQIEVSSIFDGFDVILLDNNLSALNIAGTRLTAEQIAGYLRAFSDTPFIVSLNKSPFVDFDLRYLIGDFSTRTDFAAKSEHLSNKWLWNRDAESSGDFKPWYWPELRGAASNRRNQIDFTAKNLGNQILPTLGFDAECVTALSRHAAGALSPTAAQGDGDDQSPASVTFREFFKSSNRSIPPQEDRERLLKDNDETVISRVVAAELDTWLKRDVIGPQGILTDLPHLISRMPFLLDGDPTDLSTWNACIRSPSAPFGIKEDLYHEHVKPALFDIPIWSSETLFWWPKIDSNEALKSLFYADAGDWGDFVFCEDRSEFLPRRPASAPIPMEFAAEFEGEWNRRHVAVVSDFHYAPQSRFAL